MNIKEACQLWVQRDMNVISQSIFQKAFIERERGIDEFREITPPSVYDRVYCDNGESGYITETITNEDENEIKYKIKLDNDDEIVLDDSEFEVEHDDILPMWGTMWQFDGMIDNDWLDDSENRQKMADCGFRIYETDEDGIFFGIDGAGYDFYESHWIPLYKERGLQWHDKEIEND